jgi:dipeptidyl aminopeptidase/acylaminoacyl peptidase
VKGPHVRKGFGRRATAAGIALMRVPAVALAVALAAAPADAGAAGAAAAPSAVPLEVYGGLPHLEDACVSPDGKRLAFVSTEGDTRIIAIVSLADSAILGRMRVGDAKLRGIEWADDRRLLIWTSETTVPWGLRGTRHEWFQLQVYDFAKHESRMVPDNYRLRQDRIMNTTWGRVMVRRIEGHTVLFVPTTYVAERTMPALVRVDLDSGGQRVVRKGLDDTRRWLVDENGEIAAEEDYDEESGAWAIKTRHGGGFGPIASGREPIDSPHLLGFGPNEDTLLVEMMVAGDLEWKLLSLKDGSFGPALADGQEMTAPIEDRLTHRMVGGLIVDDDYHYNFFDPLMRRNWAAIVRAFAGAHVRFVSASEDFGKLIVRVEGPAFGFVYEIVDIASLQANPVGNIYLDLVEPLESRRITYTAEDGLEIPAFLTLPRSGAARGLPLVVLPHGGPQVRDTADFDWWSQALADQGYAVLRPNYRGSALNQRFVEQGYGQWGRKMQTDLSDGVRYLVKQGIVDPQRVCIAGASYGGYAALAGVTLDPGVYRCAVSVAGPSDLGQMLEWVNDKHLSSTSGEQRYWDRFMGAQGPSDPALKKVSPIFHVEAVNAPVLLIHGKDDTVVPFDQSDDMYDALRHAGKRVELITLKHEDHWLSRGETRLQMLRAMVAFLRANNPPD